jgi:hypothetical protein
MMKRNLFLSALFALARNAIPLGLWFDGYAAESALVLYFLETLAAIALAALFVRMRAPAEHPDYADLSSTRTVITHNGRTSYHFRTGNRSTLIQNFLIFSLGFSLIPGIFMAAFLFLILRARRFPQQPSSWDWGASPLFNSSIF